MDWAPAAATRSNPYFSNPVFTSGPTSKQPDGASPADPLANAQAARSVRPPEGSSAAGPNPDFSNPDSAFGLKQSAGASAEQSKALAAASASIFPPNQTAWIIRNKADLVDYRSEARKPSYGRSEPRHPAKIDKVNKGLPERSESRFIKNELEFSISALTGVGFEAVLNALSRYAEAHLGSGEPALITRERHRRVLTDTLAALSRALRDSVSAREDLLAEELRAAAQALGRLTGRVDVEDVLDVIFRDFCIGK
jgi:tRNA modification GTPase